MTDIKNTIFKKYNNFLIFIEKYFKEDNNIFIKNITDFIYYINFYMIYFKNKTSLYLQRLLKYNNKDINSETNSDINSETNSDINSETNSETNSDINSDISNDTNIIIDFENNIDNTICNVNDKINNKNSVNLDNDTMFVNQKNQKFFNNVNKYFDQNNLYRKLYSSHLIAASMKRNNDRREYLKIKIATKILQKHFKVYRLNKSKYDNDNISKSENLNDDNIIENHSYLNFLSSSLNYFKW